MFNLNTSPLSLVLVVIVIETYFGQFSPTNKSVVLVRNPETLTTLPTSLIDLGKTGPLRR